MEPTSSPPLTPIRNYMSPLETSPSSSYRQQYRRRRTSSSLSSPHDRSPASTRNSHRFSNASRYSNDLPTPGEERGNTGLGNLADELDQLSDDEYEEGTTGHETLCDEPDDTHAGAEEARSAEGARDSGVDVSYSSPSTAGKKENQVRNFSKPFAKPPDVSEEREAEAAETETQTPSEEPLTRELEEAMTAVARIASTTPIDPDPIIPRFITALQDLGNQTSLEASSQRLTTSTNSLTNYLNAQTKHLATLSSSLYNPFYTPYAPPLDPEILASTTPLIETLLADLPSLLLLPPSSRPGSSSSSSATPRPSSSRRQPSEASLSLQTTGPTPTPTSSTTTPPPPPPAQPPQPSPHQALQKLSRDTTTVVQTLGNLTDSLQISKQASSTAARLLRSCQAVVVEMRRERERGEAAREALLASGESGGSGSGSGNGGGLYGRERGWCGRECGDVLEGFERRCGELRGELVAAAGGGG
ncbi:hypothetical protein MBLNU230_g2448t1 [Neophaeotheca triangularis]